MPLPSINLAVDTPFDSYFIVNITKINIWFPEFTNSAWVYESLHRKCEKTQ